MGVVWVLLALVGLFFGLNTLSRLFGVGGAGVVAGRRTLPVPWALLAVAALGGMFAIGYGQGRSWMVVLSWVVLGLVGLGALWFRFLAPPVERVLPGELIEQVDAYAYAPGPHSMSFAVQGSVLAMMRGQLQSSVPRTRLTRHALADGSCLYCFVEGCMSVLFATEGDRGDEIVREYRSHLRSGPNVEVHMRRQGEGDPWHLEFAVPKGQPPWNSEYGRLACDTHKPTAAG